jgi:hypothetical protein
MDNFKWKSLAIGVLLLACATIFGFSQLFQGQYAQMEALVTTPDLQQEDLLNPILYPNARLVKQTDSSDSLSDYYFETEDSPEAVMSYLFDQLQAQGWKYINSENGNTTNILREEDLNFSYERTICQQDSCYVLSAYRISLSASPASRSGITSIAYRFSRVTYIEDVLYDREWSLQ